MEILLSPDKTLAIETSVVNLGGGQPTLNGVPLEDWRCEVLHLDNQQIELLTQQIKEAEEELAQVSVQEPWAKDVPYLLQMPGIGLLTAMTSMERAHKARVGS